MIICTSICANYLGKALALGKSIKKFNAHAKFIICLTETSIPPNLPHATEYYTIILSKDLGFRNFNSFIFRHSIVEASTAVKGQLFHFLMNQHKEEQKFVYIDPDCLVYSSLEKLNILLDKHQIILTPHLLSPGNIDMEISSLKHGAFNLGFLAIKRGAESVAFIDWWRDRLYDFCYEDFNKGLFTDQKWINLAPCFFDVYILKDPGYNFATWSFKERILSKKASNYYVDEHFPLVFVHYSGYEKGNFMWANRKWAEQANQWLGEELDNIYKQYLAESNEANFKNIKWSYGTYLDGTVISDADRRSYRDMLSSGEISSDVDPFVKKLITSKIDDAVNYKIYLRKIKHKLLRMRF